MRLRPKFINKPDDTMRSPAFLSLVVLLTVANPAEARLFWQTYGSTVSTVDGCQWNANSDYFVPRHCDSCRYGLFSPCKHSCTTSPACRRCHALYPGYCSPYGCFHYCWRNHVYAHKCGCSPVAYHGPYRPGCGPGSCKTSCAMGECAFAEPCVMAGSPVDCDCQYLPNVESEGLQTLGAISLSGDPLLSTLQLGVGTAPLLPGHGTPGQMITPSASPSALPEQHLPVFGNPASHPMTPGTLSPNVP